MRNLVRRARSAAHAVAQEVVLRMPGGGPPKARGLVVLVRARLARGLLFHDDVERARLLMAPVLGLPDLPPAAQFVSTLLRAHGDDGAAALHAVRQLSHEEPGAIDIAVLHLQLAARGSQEQLAVLTRLVELRPRNRGDVALTTRALRYANDLGLAKRYQTRLKNLGVTWGERELARIIDGLRLATAHREGPEEYQRQLHALRATPQPLRTAVEGLTSAGGWAEIADLVDPPADTEPSFAPGAKFPADQVAWAARRAIEAGHLGVGVRIGRRVLAQDPDRPATREVLASADDQLALLQHGWVPPAPGTTPYESRARAVLSVLWQSVPIRSGGYATRSHGILTGLAARGWDMEGVTRLGFPYDRWPADDLRTVPPSDVVDGIRYHRLLEDGVRSYPVHPLAAYVARCADGIVDRAAAHGASLIHAASFYAVGLAGAAAARRLGLPFIYELRGLEDLMRVSRDPSFASTDRYRYLELMEQQACDHADAVFVITKALGREMARRGVPTDKMVVLPNGVHADDFAPRPRDAELEAELGLTGLPVIGYAGSMVDYEGLELLLEAVAELKAQDIAFRVVMVGDGPAERSVRAKAALLRLNDVVTFTGRVGHDEVSRYISLFDITPFPRLALPICELISPMKPFEALAMGKAVVVSSVDALTEIIADDVTGLVFTKNDRSDLAAKLRLLLESPELRARLGEAGMNWVRRERDWSAITAVADRTYAEVLERHRAAAVTR